MPVFHPCEVKPWQNVGREESLGQEGPPEKGMATYANVLAWRIPWTEKAGGLRDHKESDMTVQLKFSSKPRPY